MKLAGPSVYATTQRVVRTSSQSGRRSYAVSAQWNYNRDGISQQRQIEGIASTPLLTHQLHYRSFTRSTNDLLSSYPSSKLDPDDYGDYRESTMSRQSSTIIPKTDQVQHHRLEPVVVANSNHLPKQSSHISGILFGTIAPHLEQRTLSQLTKKLQQLVSRGHHKIDTQDREGKKASLKRKLDMLFAPGKGQKWAVVKPGSSGDTVDYSWSIKGHPWIQQTIYSYLIGDLLDKPYLDGASIPSHYQEDPTYPPNQNRQQYAKHLNTLMKTREFSVQDPIFWTEKHMVESGYSRRFRGTESPEKQESHRIKLMNLHSSKSEEQLQSEAEEILEKMISLLPPPHFHKIMGILERYADLGDFGGQRNKNDANSWIVDDDSNEGNWSRRLPALPTSEAPNISSNKNRIKVLGDSLGEVGHSHMVAPDLGRYLYNMELGGDHQHRKGPVLISDSDAVRKNRKLFSMKKKYIKSRDDFVSKMMDLQHEFASWEPTVGTQKVAQGNSNGGNMEGGDGESSDFAVNEFEHAQKQYSVESRKEQIEDLEETLVELRRMGMRHGEEARERKRRGRPKKGSHLRFTAIRVKDKGESPELTVTAEAESEETIVFINNLPIDTTETEIEEIYSRCGLLDSIQIFNQRPDLDPGLLSARQIRDRHRKKPKIKHAFESYHEFKHQRPRTPVYGMLRFRDAEGYRFATSSELCIFGCVIRRHPVVSIKHQDNTTLYLEQIPDGVVSVDVEAKLAQLLHPHNFHIMLDGLNGGGSGQLLSHASSCQVKFADFETAAQAYSLLTEGGDSDQERKDQNSIIFSEGQEAQIHWLRTPANSMQYWTRELIF